MNPGFILCVDGGGTRTRGRLVDASGAVLAQAEAGPCNPTTEVERAVASVLEVWGRVGRQAGIDRAESVILAIGAAGLVNRAAREGFLGRLPQFATAVAVSDGYAALIGASGGTPCGMLIVGTGVAGHRLTADGTSIQRDGWGWVGGDRGSGAWIGRKALRHALSVRDGLAPASRFSERVDAAAGGSEDAILAWTAGITPDRLASLAPLVLEEAAEGDPAATRILDRAIEHLAALVRALDVPETDPVYIAGGLAAALRPAIAGRAGRPLLAPQADAMTGCFLIATGRAPGERRVEMAGAA